MALILIVDDDPGVRSALRGILLRGGHEVTEEPDGLRALTALRAPDARHPDVIIVDMYMPEMDGIEFLMHLADVAPGIPTIATSGGGMINNMLVLDDAVQLGAAALLPKPFTSGDVSRVLAEVLQPEVEPLGGQDPTSKPWPPHP
jgi:CheY-like chemotaxis protein